MSHLVASFLLELCVGEIFSLYDDHWIPTFEDCAKKSSCPDGCLCCQDACRKNATAAKHCVINITSNIINVWMSDELRSNMCKFESVCQSRGHWNSQSFSLGCVWITLTHIPCPHCRQGHSGSSLPLLDHQLLGRLHQLSASCSMHLLFTWRQ